ncbi:class I SAM-dependent methyltransferase [Williamsia phyllosphaerae]|uniref:Class I SAM-dependent methyltransferase n=1 Tax=Williamsia phyllosphaerae TaxID=885042 RepID=A0ABQ1UWL7_9NOCA|nr:class I SAM-dependent methyltransferase [Williamsia phyllosphaerae]GGF28662.1 hypothetical protein GCM10007298_25590 [Williamsia phyllosphaerae]
MQRTFDGYARVGHRLVQGWAQREVFALLRLIDTQQRDRGITGGVAEIGVHHGQLFIGMDLLLRDGEKSVAIDIFGDQDLNIDASGKGDRARFVRNVERFAGADGVEIHQGDSTVVTPEELTALAGDRIRLFSVDGGHTEEVVLSDMTLAEETLSAGGVVVADDVFNAAWPEVVVGTLRYLERPTALAPFAIGYNKVFFADADHSDDYRAAITAQYQDRALFHCRASSFAGHPVVLIADVAKTPRELLARSSVARSIHGRLTGS